TRQPSFLMKRADLILFAEDDRNDVFFLRRAFLQVGRPVNIVDVRNGQQAINYLQGEGFYSDRENFPYPSLLILDLKLPLMDGFQVLGWLKDHPEAGKIPAVVLSASAREEEMARARELGARECFLKPADPRGLADFAKRVSATFLNGNG
ncbi:MAG TPA: response regulator, partial [Verrucomicrobiae bacterium]|nr:response regulator [Verrucomicrobiae bacterium]